MTSKAIADLALDVPARPLRRLRLSVTEAGALEVTGRSGKAASMRGSGIGISQYRPVSLLAR